MLVFFLSLWFLACEKEAAVKSSEADLLSFSIKELSETFTINDDLSVETLVADETDVTELTAVFQVSEKATVYIGSKLQTSGYSKNDFSNPITYKIEAEDGTTTTYTVYINKSPKIKSFSIKELANTTFAINDLAITAEVQSGTALTDLTAEYNISERSTLYINDTEQVSGETQNDFTSPVHYKLVAENGAEKQYTVTITVAANQLPEAKAGEDKLILVQPGTTSATVTLDGSASSDAEGDIAAFEWSEGASVLATTAQADVNFALGIHTITLKVTDGSGATAEDELTVEIRETGTYQPIDADASAETVNLLKNIANIANSDKFIFGQEFPLSFKLSGTRDNLSTSDCKEVTGDHPGVYGIDPHYMMYKTAAQKQMHIDEAKHAYNNGSIVTVDFHQQSRSDHKIYMNDITTQSDRDLMYDIVNDNNSARDWFYGELDEVLDIINNDFGFPVVFRLFHEMDGNWFWWGTAATNHSSQLYIDFYRLAVNYVKSRSQLVLFAWSPNSELNTAYYPGDAYVDIVGFDIYEPSKTDLKNKLVNLSTFAVQHNKPAILAETGHRNNFVANDPDFWTNTVLAAIKEGGNEVRIAWVLAWFNAPWHSTQDKLIIPDANSPAAAKDDFILFKNDAQTLFQQDVDALNVYQ